MLFLIDSEGISVSYVLMKEMSSFTLFDRQSNVIVKGGVFVYKIPVELLFI